MKEIFGKTRNEVIKIIELKGKYKKYRIILKNDEKYEGFTTIYIQNIDYGSIKCIYTIKTNTVFEIIDNENVIEWIKEYQEEFED